MELFYFFYKHLEEKSNWKVSIINLMGGKEIK